MKEILKDKKTYFLGGIVGTVTYLISWLINLLGIAPKTIKIGSFVQVTGALVDINIREQLASGGVANRLGLKVMQLLTAVPKFNLTELITMIAGSIILVIIGKWIYSWKITPKWKNTPPWVLAGELFYGAIVITLAVTLLGGLGMAGLPTLAITMALYYLGVALIVGLLTRVGMIKRLID